jgi:hypothetical protein
MDFLTDPTQSDPLFEYKTVEVVQNIATGQLEEMMQWLVKEVTSLSEQRKKFCLKSLCDRIDELESGNEAIRSQAKSMAVMQVRRACSLSVTLRKTCSIAMCASY